MGPALILSSDSHVVEPPDLWTTRIEAAFRARAPRMQRLDGAAVQRLARRRSTRRMRENLDLSGGLIMAEALMLELGKQIGRQRAHDAVYEPAQAAVRGALSPVRRAWRRDGP
jgi:hypothetical protein